MTFKLLAGNAEQEQNLLRLGVNKLGDNEKSVASKASHHLLVLLQNHPAMKAVVVREVSALVLKPVASKTVHPVAAKGKNAASAPEAGLDHARYYGLVTLNQIMLTSRDRDVAAKLVDVYFDVFRELLQATPDADKGAAEDDPEASAKARTERIAGKIHNFQGRKKGTRLSKRRGQQREGEEVEQGDAKLIAAVLTGVTRALPFARLDESVFSAHAETLFRVTHTATFNISLRALMLIYQIAEAKEVSLHNVRHHFWPLTLRLRALWTDTTAFFTTRCSTLASSPRPSRQCTSTCCSSPFERTGTWAA